MLQTCALSVLMFTGASQFALVGVIVITFAHPWSSALVPDRFDRPEAIPQPWIDTGHYLDRVGGRAMLVPGIDFAASTFTEEGPPDPGENI